MGKNKTFYEVQYITKMKVEGTKRIFRVKWVNYPSSQNTWEPQQHLAKQLVDSFLEQQNRRQRAKEVKKNQKEVEHTCKNQLRIIEILPKQENQSKQERCFTISQGNRREVVTRQYLYKNHPHKLARFYLKLYEENKSRA